MDRRAEKSLVNSVFIKSVNLRKTTRSTIIHADYGSQFTSWESTENVAAFKIKLSMGTVGDCFGNAIIEEFLGRMQTELLDCQSWMECIEFSAAMAEYIEVFHNQKRRH